MGGQAGRRDWPADTFALVRVSPARRPAARPQPQPHQQQTTAMVAANPLATDASGGYSGAPMAPRPTLTTSGGSVAMATTPPPPAAPEPAKAPALPTAPTNFTYTYNEATSHGGLATGAAHMAMSTVASITDTLAYLIPLGKRKQARGSGSADAAAAAAIASGGGAADAGKNEGAVPLRVMTSKFLATHPHRVHLPPGATGAPDPSVSSTGGGPPGEAAGARPAPDNVYMVFNVNTSLLFVDYTGLHRVRGSLCVNGHGREAH